ncbi:unnamed protein product [Moneuplotes crassus]|uniref:Secreted protein n=1 Tax=Euplotes crassus TaxID=5936 RepID=A0AAD1XWH0_EUPCR|nr:unnamed protein product [Moneuplotes crassus]
MKISGIIFLITFILFAASALGSPRSYPSTGVKNGLFRTFSAETAKVLPQEDSQLENILSALEEGAESELFALKQSFDVLMPVIEFLTSFWRAAFQIDLNLDGCPSRFFDGFLRIGAGAGKIVAGPETSDRLWGVGRSLYGIVFTYFVQTSLECDDTFSAVLVGLEKISKLVSSPSTILPALSKAFSETPVEFWLHGDGVISAARSDPIELGPLSHSLGGALGLILNAME